MMSSTSILPSEAELTAQEEAFEQERDEALHYFNKEVCYLFPYTEVATLIDDSDDEIAAQGLSLLEIVEHMREGYTPIPF